MSFAVTAKLICGFVFAYAKIPFSHDVAHIIVSHLIIYMLTLVIRVCGEIKCEICHACS